ncbi:dihydrofolate reductase family protein [Halocynthiibacter styelae]|uniref:Dihydrofolate reductase n=1 Tax=Halocynthiibacter styelae TaxID=2761955 RepID=A0A8J7IX55_9RHOB|nr:dihydrofolate reductase family protein [Paenihalocynthiibacter styelae]MBI1493630.1 dihydrofolate reductase [Paenihalocynthiibacter styelae]
MQPIIYDVAVSLDGFISGPGGDVSKFVHDGPVAEDYAARLCGYSVALMGRKTYEFGYDFGLIPGQNPYPGMESYVFSQSLQVPDACQISVVSDDWDLKIRELKASSPGPVYLCGGGAFAGRLLKAGLIDQLILKRAPCVYGGGVSLFGEQSVSGAFTRRALEHYDNGYILERFDVS